MFQKAKKTSHYEAEVHRQQKGPPFHWCRRMTNTEAKEKKESKTKKWGSIAKTKINLLFDALNC